MTDAIKKTPDANGVYPYVENIIDIAGYPSSDWHYDPDTSALTGSPAVDRNYWIYVSDNDAKCGEMNQAQKDAVDEALATLPIQEAQLFMDCYEYAPDETRDIYLPTEFSSVVAHVNDPNVIELVGATIVSPSGTGWDPGNVSTGEATLNNGVHTDLCYNNSSISNTTGIVLGIDMGTPTAITGMRKCDYSATYYDTQWEFIGTNDSLVGKDTAGRFTLGGSPNVSWEVIFTQNQTEASLYATDGGTFRAFEEVTYRYYGWRCVTSNNASYTIATELELYSGGSLMTVEKQLTENIEYEYLKTAGNHVTVKNITAETRTFKVILIGTE